MFKRFKKSRLHIDKDLYKNTKYNTLKLITAKNTKQFLIISSQNILKNQKNYGKP